MGVLAVLAAHLTPASSTSVLNCVDRAAGRVVWPVRAAVIRRRSLRSVSAVGVKLAGGHAVGYCFKRADPGFRLVRPDVVRCGLLLIYSRLLSFGIGC